MTNAKKGPKHRAKRQRARRAEPVVGGDPRLLLAHRELELARALGTRREGVRRRKLEQAKIEYQDRVGMDRTGTTSLFAIAPRLALAVYTRRWERSVLDEFVGDLRRATTARHAVERCERCGGWNDVVRVRGVMLQGPNEGAAVNGVYRICRTARCVRSLASW